MDCNPLISFGFDAPSSFTLFALLLTVAISSVGYILSKKLFSKHSTNSKKFRTIHSQANSSQQPHTTEIKSNETIEDINIDYANLRREVRYLQDEIMDLQMQLKNKREQLIRVIGEREEKEREIISLRRKITDLQEIVHSLRLQLKEKHQHLLREKDEKERIKRRLQEIHDRTRNAPPEIKAMIEGRNFEPFDVTHLVAKAQRLQEEWEKAKATHAIYPFKPIFTKIKEISNLQDAYIIMGKPYYSAEQVMSFFEKILTDMKQNRYLWDALEWLKRRYG